MRARRALVVVVVVLLWATRVAAQVVITPGYSSRPYLNLFQAAQTVNTQPVLNLTTTWNAGAVTFTGIKFVITDTASASASMAMQLFGGAAGTTNLFSVNSSGAGTFGESVTATTLTATNASITLGADGTVTDEGSLVTQVYQVSVTATTCATAFEAAALTADCTIATLPVKTRLTAVYGDVTEAFTCSGTCTGTKTIGAGITGGGTEILAAALDVAATGQFGLADADLGSAMTRAAAIQGGYLPSWSATTDVIVRFTSGTGNWGDGAGATFVDAGAITLTLITERLP